MNGAKLNVVIIDFYPCPLCTIRRGDEFAAGWSSNVDVGPASGREANATPMF